MEIKNPHAPGGSLQISSDVIAKIAKLATLEVEGVDSVDLGAASGSLLNKIAPQSPIRVDLTDDVADIEVSITVKYGVKIPEVSEKIQQNVKSSVQSMTGITVTKVNVVVASVAAEG